MIRALVGLGGNVGDPKAAMRKALALMTADRGTTVIKVSSLYRTPPWGKLDQPDFLNAVAELQTSLSARQLLDLCLRVETELKRVRVERWGPRSIDIDLLWFGGEHVNESGLEIPHPRMLERAFVMVPLAEIAPDLLLDGVRADARVLCLDQGGISVAARRDGWWRSTESKV